MPATSARLQTFCRICEPFCPLIAVTDAAGEVSKILPARDHPVSRGHACHKGIRYWEVNRDPLRINFPNRRLNARAASAGEFGEVSWDAALDDIASRIRKTRATHGPEAVALYIGNPFGTDSTAFPALIRFMTRLGISRRFSAGTQDCANKFATAQAVYGDSMSIPIPDLENTDYLLCLGSNPKVSKMTLVSVPNPEHALGGILNRGGRIRYINPRRIESVTAKDGISHTSIRPDTDVYLLAAVLLEIERTVGFDAESVSVLGRNIEGLRDFISHFPAERVAAVTGVEAAEIRGIAHAFCSARSAAAYSATGGNMGRQGTTLYWLINMLNFVTGNLGRAGGAVFRPPVAAQFGANDPMPAANQIYADSPFGPIRTILGDFPGNLLADFINLEERPIRALIVLAGNPLLSIGGEERLSAAFNKLDLLVSFDLYKNATGDKADYVLPGTDWLERRDVNALGFGQTTPFVLYSDVVVAPKFARRSAWWMFASIEKRLGLPSLLDEPDPDPYRVQDEMLARLGTSVEELKRLPHQSKLLEVAAPKETFKIGVYHADGKVDCCPEAFAPLIERAHELFAELCRESPHQLKLIGLRTVQMHNSNAFPAARRGTAAVNQLHVNPQDAYERGVADGDDVRVRTAFGDVITKARFDSRLRPGVVAMPHGYDNRYSDHTANCNRLLPSGPGSYEPFSNQAFMSGVPVELTRIAQPATSTDPPDG